MLPLLDLTLTLRSLFQLVLRWRLLARIVLFALCIQRIGWADFSGVLRRHWSWCFLFALQCLFAIFPLQVNGQVGSPPVISFIAPQTIDEDGALPIQGIAMLDPDDLQGANPLIVTGVSSNTNLVQHTNILCLPNGFTSEIRIFPSTNQFGTNTITIIARDISGLTATNSFLFTVRPVNDPPTVLLNSPTNQQIFIASTPILLMASASDVDATNDLAKIEFFRANADGAVAKLAESTNSPYTFAWQGVATGLYDVWAQATDRQGATTATERVRINVIGFVVPLPLEITIPEGESRRVFIPGGSPDQTNSLDYATADLSAAGGFDYVRLSGQLVWKPGESVTSLVIQTREDALNEASEEFVVVWSNPSNGFFPATQLKVTIIDNDPIPSVSIDDIEIAEGITQAALTLSLSAPSGRGFAIDYGTVGETATPGRDFVPSFDTIGFQPGETSRTITVPIIADALSEAPETLSVFIDTLDDAVTIHKRQGRITIKDDDLAPALSINSVTVREGNSGSTNAAVFTVSLSTVSGQQVSIDYETANGTAQAGNDFVPTSGTLTFEPGQTNRTAVVQVKGDAEIEGPEFFRVFLFKPTNATVPVDQASGTVTIIDAELVPALLVQNVTVTEGNVGPTNAIFSVSLSTASAQTVTVDFATTNDTAQANLDYVHTSGQLTFTPEQTSQSFTVQVNGDTTIETNEVFWVRFSNAINATLAVPQVQATIVDDERKPELSVADAEVIEGNDGLAKADFTITLSPPTTESVTVDFVTRSETATSEGADFVPQFTKVVFEPEATRKTVSVQVIGDVVNEPDEHFSVLLTSPAQATIAPGQGVARGTIRNDDALPIVSIADVTVTEGIDGPVSVVVAVALSIASGQTVTLDVATMGGTAGPGTDYVPITNRVTFNPGQISQAINIKVLDDRLDEIDETVLIHLLNPTNAVVLESPARLTILDNDDPLPTIVVKETRVIEGNTGFILVDVPVTLSAPSDQPINVRFATADGSAVEGKDYSRREGNFSFPRGETVHREVVMINGDVLDEDDETFFVEITDESGIVTRLPVVIEDNDPLPVLIITDAAVTEGNSDTTVAGFEVRLSEPSGRNVSVTVATAGETARAGSDYDAFTPTLLTFSPGQTLKQIRVTIKGDSLPEPEETFLVILSNPVNASLPDDRAIGTITDDDAPIGLSISDASVTETDNGAINAIFVVTLSAPTDQEVTVQYATADDSADDQTDYIGTPGALTLTFPAGSVTPRTIPVPVRGDLLNEPVERFFVNLTNASPNVGIFDGQGVGTITDNDPQPRISISDGTGAEGGSVDFSIQLSMPSGQAVIVPFETANGTALSGSDYVAKAGQVTFAPGQKEQFISILTVDDGIHESLEDFFVQLRDPANAELARNRAAGTIADNDVLPALSISNATVWEGNSGTTNALFTVTLNAASSEIVSVKFTTTDGSAAAPADYLARSGLLTFPAGTTTQTITITVNGDIIDEPHENFFVDLSEPVNAALSVNKRGVCDIIDDDVEPTLSITDASAPEGSSATNRMTFTIRLSAPSSQTVTAKFATGDGTARAGADYAAASGMLTFAPGTLTNSIAVLLIPDALDEANETFEVKITDVRFAGLSDGVGLGTIIDDDVPPTMTITDAVVSEGNTGTTNATFLVLLSTASAQTVTVDFQTADGTARAGSDYVRRSGTLTFPPGTAAQPLFITVTGDTLFETNETFFVTLTNAVNATLIDSLGLGTILNDDAAANQPPTVQIVKPANGSPFTAPAEIPIEVNARDPEGSIQRVEFFVGSSLIGRVTTPPFSLTWTNEAAGAYSITAVATDNQGASATSDPVHVLVSRSIAVADVAVVRNSSHPEIPLLQDYLLELGVSSQVFDQEGLAFDALRDFRLVIWDDLGVASQGLTDNDVAIFRQAFNNEMSLLFLGEALMASADNLSAAQRSAWSALTRLAPSPTQRGNGTVMLDQAGSHPVLNGHFGIVGNFTVATVVNSAVQSAPGVTVLGKSGGADVFVVFEDESFGTRTRTITQHFSLTSPSDPRSTAERKKLFKNSISWLLRKNFQSLTDLSVRMTGPNEPAVTGRPLTYSVHIGQQGEIAGSGVTVTIPLPAGMRFVNATFAQGSISEAGGAVVYQLGSMDSGQQTTFAFTVISSVAGTNTIALSVTGNEADPNLSNNTASIETVLSGDTSTGPKLVVQRSSDKSLQLVLAGDSQKTYRLQSSTNLMNWVDVTTFIGTISTNIPNAAEGKRFYRIVSP